MFEFDDVELSGPLPLLLSSTFVPGTVFSVVEADAGATNASTKAASKANPTANRTRISHPPAVFRADLHGRDRPRRPTSVRRFYFPPDPGRRNHQHRPLGSRLGKRIDELGGQCASALGAGSSIRMIAEQQVPAGRASAQVAEPDPRRRRKERGVSPPR